MFDWVTPPCGKCSVRQETWLTNLPRTTGMASTWKLTKKLKETHLSSAFLGKGERQDRDGSRSNTIVAKKSSDDMATPRGTMSAPKPSRVEEKKDTAHNPALLRVKIYEITNLHIDESIRALLPSWCFDKSSTRPPPVYLVLEFDRTQIILHAIGGTCDNPTWDKTSSFDANASNPVLSVQVYVRPPKADPLVIGSVQVNCAKPGAQTVSLQSNSGKLRLETETHQTKNQPFTIDDFELLKVVGKGSFGKVMQVLKKDTHQIYALKTLRKAHIVSRSEVGHTLAERTVLAKIRNPFIVPLKFSFQSPEKLYLVLAFVNGGELFHHLQREGRFDLNRARFYTAELLCALECLHEYNVIYRDLKPENILLDYTGHIALCDFGLCKLNMAGQEKTNTFCGTPEYLAPELLLGQGYTKVVDYWTLGVLFYEMLTGLPPFYDQDTNAMYHKILKNPLVFPSDMDQEARSLLTGLLERDPKKRLGVNGASEIKAHPFFRNIDWKCLLNKKYAAPFQPSVASATDTSNFDKEFTSEIPMDSVVDKDYYLSESVQKQFGGWSYTNTDSKLASS